MSVKIKVRVEVRVGITLRVEIIFGVNTVNAQDRTDVNK